MAKGDVSAAASGAPGCAGACALLPEEATGEMEDADTIQNPNIAMTTQSAQPCFRIGQSKGRTREFPADSPAFCRFSASACSTKDRAVHAQSGKLCRPSTSFEAAEFLDFRAHRLRA